MNEPNTCRTKKPKRARTGMCDAAARHRHATGQTADAWDLAINNVPSVIPAKSLPST